MEVLELLFVPGGIDLLQPLQGGFGCDGLLLVLEGWLFFGQNERCVDYLQAATVLSATTK